MPARKPSPPRNADNPEQSRRFIDTARQLEAEEPAEDVDLILRRLASGERQEKVIRRAGDLPRPSAPEKEKGA